MRRRLVIGAAIMAAGGALGGCQVSDPGTNVINGKEQFVARCGSCHVLERAGTTGVTGPNLDEAFQRARQDGLGESTFEGMVYAQILNPNPDAQTDPQTGKPTAAMPSNLVTGDDAEDVAAYVASAAGKRGKDSGRLADVGAKQAEGTARAEGGVLTIPATGGTAYRFADAVAEPGSLTIESPNESPVEHNIAVEGDGLDVKGPVVPNGGNSEIEVDLQAGEYTFYCSVPGHREAGMEGPLRVEG
jgi:plastocyanin